jgi:glycosyltransferase involved in cell wall biosynthesis
MNPKTAPRVSVVIPVYNRARYVSTAIDSILAQSLTDFELIVIDDGSTDESCAVVEAYTDPRIRLIRNERNLGIPATRNRGLEAARGVYMALLDSDDWAYPKRLAKQAAFLDKNPEHVIVGSWARWVDSEGKHVKKIKRRPVRADDAAATLIFQSCLQQSAVMGRTAVLKRYGYSEAFDLSSDYELWVRLSEEHKIANLPQTLVRYRDHGQRTTRANTERVRDRQKAIYRYQLNALGLDYNEADVTRHQQLPRMNKNAIEPDAEFMDWAEQWIMGLLTANRQQKRYPQTALVRVLGWEWARLCLHAGRYQRLPAWRRFRASRLKGSALSGALRQGLLHTCPGVLARG